MNLLVLVHWDKEATTKISGNKAASVSPKPYTKGGDGLTSRKLQSVKYGSSFTISSLDSRVLGFSSHRTFLKCKSFKRLRNCCVIHLWYKYK